VRDQVRARRSCLAVPGSSDRMIEKARGLAADEFFLDLEDACAPAAKPGARATVAAALNEGDWGGKIRAVRINDATTEWSYRDVVDVIEAAGANIDCVILPKADEPAQVSWLDLLLTQIEKAMGYPAGRIGIEAQIESARGLMNADEIAAASPRTEALIFGPADFIASVGIKARTVGEQPAGYEAGDAYHYALMRLLVAARANGLQAIDGPYLQVRDQPGFRRAAMSSAALGYDGRWVLHPDQIGVANEVFRPGQEDYDWAENVLDAYAWHTSEAGGLRGAAMLGDEMIDEASRKIALRVAGQGRAAGMRRKEQWAPPS
jgi:citrate lyase subunit beta / citryl-CoA lyase